MRPVAMVVALLAVAGAASSRRPAASSARRLGRLASTMPAGGDAQLRAIRSAAVGVVALATVTAVLGLAGTAVVLSACAAVAAFGRRARRARRRAETRAGIVDLCRGMATELRSGRPLGEAFAAAVDGCAPMLRALLQPAVAVGRRGDPADLADAVISAAVQPDVEGLRRIAACWRVAAVSGAALAPAIDRVADALQDEIDLGRDVTAVLAGPRATVHLLAALPVIGLLLGTAIGARPVDFLVRSGPGLACLCVAGALDAVGVVWARHIAVRAASLG